MQPASIVGVIGDVWRCPVVVWGAEAEELHCAAILRKQILFELNIVLSTDI